MGLIQAFAGALGGTLADQWKDIITAGTFGEYTAVAPGVFRQSNNGRGTNNRGSADVISNGSKIFVPENTAAFIFSQAGIEEVITTAGGYEYQSGQSSIFNGDGFRESITSQVGQRFGFGGQTSEQKYIAFVNLREIRGLKFGTRGPLVYNDLFYGADLEIFAFGSFSLRIVDPAIFVRNFVPANLRYYSFDTNEARQQISSEFLQAFTVALNSLSTTFRISQLPGQADTIARAISGSESLAESWVTRFGLEVVRVGIESIEFAPASRELVQQYSSNLMNLKAFEGVSQHASNVSAQQKIAQGVENHGLGETAGAIFGMNLAGGLNAQTGAAPAAAGAAAVGGALVGTPAPAPTGGDSGRAPVAPAAPMLSLDEQIEMVKKLKELVDVGILTADEFETKKKQIMGL